MRISTLAERAETHKRREGIRDAHLKKGISLSNTHHSRARINYT